MKEQTIIEATETHKKTIFLIIIFALPNIGVILLFGPVISVLGGIYAKYYNFSLTSIALVILIAKVFDAVTDPIIGCYSDRWREKTGSRKPFVLMGGLLVIPSSYFLFAPPEGVGIAYFASWYMLFYLSVTTFTIPYLAWANEFTANSKEKTLTFCAINISGQLGGALFYCLPLLPFFVSSDITPEVLKITAFAGAALLLPGLFLALTLVPNNRVQGNPNSRSIKSTAPAEKIIPILRTIFNNRPFLLFIVAMLSSGIGIGMWFSVFFIYVDSYLKLGDFFASLSLWGMLCGALAIPIWYPLTLIWEKRKVWILCLSMLAGVYVCIGLVTPAESASSAIFMINLLLTFSAAAQAVVVGPILCDIIDYGRLKNKIECSALYFSIQGLLIKTPLAIGSALGFAIIGWLGFDSHATVQTAQGIMGLKLGASWIPALSVVISIGFIAFMSLNEHRVTIIRRRLTARDERLLNAESHQPATGVTDLKADMRQAS